jgi:hypothetical protein
MVKITRRSMTRLAAATVLLAGTRQLAAQNATLDDDIAVLRAAMDIHPGSLRYLNPAALDASLVQLRKELAATEATAKRYLALSRFLSKLRCGHTYANFYNQSKSLQSALFDRPTRLPFAFRWLDDVMVVTDAAPGVDLQRGSVIKRINGVATVDVLNSLLPYTRADGTSSGKRKALLEVQHRDEFEFFDVFHGLVYGDPQGGMHQLEYVDPEGHEREQCVAPISLAERQALRAEKQGTRGAQDALWRFEVRDGVGVLTMADWSVYKTEWDWRTWLDVQLDRAAELRGLVIDNRQNEGGNPEVGFHMLSRMINEPLPFPKYARLVRFRTLPESIRPFAKTWDSHFYNIGENAEPVGRGFLKLSADKDAPQQIDPRGKLVTTPAVLLTSPTNSSAAFTFALLAKSSRRLQLVGETTGGNRRGINGDGYFFTTLPNCGIEFDIPIVGKFPYTPEPDAGVVPDIPVTESVADISTGNDRTMEVAIALLRGKVSGTWGTS